METKTNPWSVPQDMTFPQQVHLSDYINIIRRRKWTVIIFFLAVVGLVTGVSFYTQPVYRATTQIFVGNQPSALSGIKEMSPPASGQAEYYQTQYNLLRSRSLAYKVIRDLDLWKDVAVDKTGNAHASISASEQSGSHGDNQGPKSQFESMIADWYLSNLQITPVRGSQLVDVSFLGSSPELITRVVNAHAHAFIEKNIQTQTSAAEQTLDWLKTQLKDQKAKVEASQRAIYKYQKANKKNFSQIQRLN